MEFMRSTKVSILIILIILLLQIFAGYGCKDKGAEPLTLKPGKRNYVWTVDVLSYPKSDQVLMYDIWASSPKDVYVVGHNDRGGYGAMFHYNGFAWEPVELMASKGGTLTQGFDLYDIYGFSSKDIYVVGGYGYDNPNPPPYFLDSSLIIHYNGITWNDIKIPRREELRCVAGYPPNKIWAGGYHGTIYYYDGIQFTIYNIGKEFSLRSIACVSPNEVYATADRFDYDFPIDSTGYFFFKFNGTTWKLIDSVMQIVGAQSPHFGCQLWTDGKILYSSGPNLYKYNNKEWEKILTANVGHMSKTGENNIFATGEYTYHYNGIDWAILYPNDKYNGGHGIFAVNDEVFILTEDLDNIPQKTIVLHGK
jgi:hypothetical protein